MCVFTRGNEGSQRDLFVVGPPFRPAFRASSLRGGVPKCLKICSKNHFLSNSRCNAGPEFWSKLIQIEASSLLGPPSGQHYVESCSKSDFPKFLKICSKIHFLSNSRCNAGPDFWLKLIQIEASSLLGVSLAPVCGQNSIALASWGVFGCFLHTSIRTSRLEGRRAGRCILRRRDSRCVVS